MKHFMIKYRFTTGTEESWHGEIKKFIAALNADPAVKGKITYRCMKHRDGNDYYHIAGAEDQQAIKALQACSFFPHYTKETERVAGGHVEVLPLDIIAETDFRA